MERREQRSGKGAMGKGRQMRTFSGVRREVIREVKLSGKGSWARRLATRLGRKRYRREQGSGKGAMGKGEAGEGFFGSEERSDNRGQGREAGEGKRTMARERRGKARRSGKAMKENGNQGG